MFANTKFYSKEIHYERRCRNRTVIEDTFIHAIERASDHLETDVSLLTAQQLTSHHQERDLYILESTLLATGLLTATIHIGLKKGVFADCTGSKNKPDNSEE